MSRNYEDTDYVRHLTRVIDRARAKGMPKYQRMQLAEKLVTAAEVLRDDESETMDEAEWVAADTLARVRSGHRPSTHPDVFEYFSPDDIRDQHGRFLSKLVRDRIYNAWQGGGRQD